MLTIPPTSRQRYISNMVALNIHSPNGTGDWHSAATFAKPIPEYLFLCGDNQPNIVNMLYFSYGVGSPCRITHTVFGLPPCMKNKSH